ncbi:MAG: penicillin-binding protein [Oscillospiraceae bacterium]|nr:penicillin-binding protein [Oscillospiraceae bacterium]
MKKVATRSLFVLILIAVVFAGVSMFVCQYFAKADEWVVFPGSPHIYSGGNLTCGVVTDRDGEVLLDSRNGLDFSADEEIRKSFIHLLGDRNGSIYAPLLGEYAERMIGYNKITGLYIEDGGEISAKLTVDADVQKTALQALDGRRGTVGVYNYKTGEILCAVSSPAYDPDDVPDIEGDTTGKYEGVYVNRFFRSSYTPGSIFKIVTTAAAIDQIEDVYHQKFTCEGETIIGSQRVICEKAHGETDFSDGFARSCNCVFGRLSVQLGGKTLEKYVRDAGLDGSYSVDGYKTAKGHFELNKAGDGDVAWAGIGQYTNQVNAYAFMRYMGMIGGGGTAAEPYLMQTIVRDGSNSYDAKIRMTERAVKEETAEKLATMMHYNVVKVYGEQQFPNLYVCAKSGTAEHEGEVSDAMFAGFIKDETYPLAFVVFIENGGSGSAAAGPVAAKVLHKCVEEMVDSE